MGWPSPFDHGTDALIRLDPKDNGRVMEGPEKGAVGCEDDVLPTQRGAKRTHRNLYNHWVVGIPSWERSDIPTQGTFESMIFLFTRWDMWWFPGGSLDFLWCIHLEHWGLNMVRWWLPSLWPFCLQGDVSWAPNPDMHWKLPLDVLKLGEQKIGGSHPPKAKISP